MCICIHAYMHACILVHASGAHERQPVRVDEIEGLEHHIPAPCTQQPPPNEDNTHIAPRSGEEQCEDSEGWARSTERRRLARQRPAPACLSSSAAAAPSRASLHARTVVMWGSAASMRATALPMPLLAPVTTATRALPPAVAWPHASPRTISGKPRALLCRNHTKTPSTAAHGALPAPGA
jgi:hypothetical protein